MKQLTYRYDQFLNLNSQVKGFYLRDAAGAIRYDSACQPIAASATERYDYDDLQRLTGATRMWDGMTWQSPTTPADTYAYDDLGNIISKSDYGDQYVYGSAARTNGLAGPHAVTSISMAGFPKASFQYDPNGNLVHSDGPDGRVIRFDDYDRPTKVEMGGATTLFRYAPDGSRYLQQTTTSTGTKTVYYVGKEYQRVDWSSRPTEEQVYIGPSVVVYQSGSARDVRYLHLDRLGSVESVTTSTAAEAIADAHSFDAFGKPRARDWQANGDKLHPAGAFGATTEHGFTGHEHLDDTFLIHMNGRVYDYRMGRFLSVDPIISNPANSQSINPYSYIGNNPLSGVDPTGYAIEDTPLENLRKCADGEGTGCTSRADFFHNEMGMSSSQMSGSWSTAGGSSRKTPGRNGSNPKIGLTGSTDETGAPGRDGSCSSGPHANHAATTVNSFSSTAYTNESRQGPNSHIRGRWP